MLVEIEITGTFKEFEEFLAKQKEGGSDQKRKTVSKGELEKYESPDTVSEWGSLVMSLQMYPLF